MSNKAKDKAMKSAATGAHIPKRRFPEFREAGEWKNKQLGDVADVNASGDLDLNLFSSTMTDQHIYPVYSNSVTQEGLYGYYAQPKYAKNSVTITARGTLGVAFNRTQDFMGIGRLLIISDLKNVDPYFLSEIWNFSADIPLENGGIPQLTAVKARSVELSIPALNEQKKIAGCLTSIDELITLETQKLDRLKTHKKGLQQQLFPAEGKNLPKLRFPEFRDSGEWEELELGPLATKVGSGITPTGGDKNYKPEGRMFVRSQNVGWGELILDDVAFIDEETHLSFSSTEIKTSDVLLNITGASIGRSAVADSRISGGNVNQHVCIIRVKQGDLNPALLNQFLISERGQKQIDSFQAGGNRQGLNFSQIRSFNIPLPPTENEQRRIADCLSSLDNLITTQAQKLATLKTHKKGLMQQLFPVMDEVSV